MELVDIVDHEDGGATYSFDLDKDAAKNVAEVGLTILLFCGVCQVDLQEVYDWILSQAKENKDVG